jgi:hypothetical protein
MNLNTQICTNKKQSERLLALGLKVETADMYITNASTKGLSYTDDWMIGSSSYMEVISFWEASGLKTERTAWEIIPTWSLHRLIAMYCSGLISCQYNLVGLSFDGLIGHIEAAIKTDKFNEEYLNKQP